VCSSDLVRSVILGGRRQSTFRNQGRRQAVGFLDDFERRQIAKRLDAAASSAWVAPPGFSEHHTGFSLDIGDGRRTMLTLSGMAGITRETSGDSTRMGTSSSSIERRI
jgi:LAS superfamily LD-carboxypeptidase LdcB